MKRNIAFALLFAVLINLLSGCGFWMEGEYTFEEPYDPNHSGAVKNSIAVSSYTQMRNALVNLVETGADNGIFDVSNFNGGSVRFFLDASIRYVKNSNPMGAYAVEDITYEIGTNTGSQAIALNIIYRHDRAQIMKIIGSYTMDEAKESLVDILRTFSSVAVLRVSKYEELDFQSWIYEYAINNPGEIIEIPEIVVNTYPQKGTDRILTFDIVYSYETEELRMMKEDVDRIINIPSTEINDLTSDRDRYTALYDFLTGDGIYILDETTTPAYSVLVNHAGDCAAFASVYLWLCSEYGLECYLISGTYNDQPWFWNLIRVGEQYYHLDILRCYQEGDFNLLSESYMTSYIWDYGTYPEQ